MHDAFIPLDARLRALTEALASRAAGASPRTPPEGYREAAVSLVLRSSDALELLLIKRARSDRDPWSGHMALPGGRRDVSDPDVRVTALRETREETGVDLERSGTPLGQLDIVAPVSRRLPRLAISPFVFAVPAEIEARVASPEVERIHWIPLDAFHAPETHATLEVPMPGGGTATFPCFRVADDVVWGLTYRILHQLLRVHPRGGA